jgi:tRNA pseudouridine32 synthase/23S rRNA pseudouridine746 synthase
MELLHADSACVVLSKPAGLLSVPGRSEPDCALVRLQQMDGGRYADALTVHRLDMDTSGLIVFARGAAAQRALSIAFMRRQVQKRYLAVVAGALDAAGGATSGRPTDTTAIGLGGDHTTTTAGAVPHGEITLPLAADWPRRPLQKVCLLSGKPALTRWRWSASEPGPPERSRVVLEPVTGRSHQLRVHLAAIGHPILGDRFYADAQVAAAAPRLLLHACELGFAHPVGGQALRFSEAAPF